MSGIDNVAAARDATAHLITLGRRRVAAIGHQSRSPGETGQLRSAGYRDALRAAGLPFPKSLVIPAPSFHRDSGAAAMEQLLGLPRRPDAVFCYNDLLAIGAMRTILSHGLRIPEDIAVAGFDDIEEARYSFPSLTTISPDKQQIARLAVARLIERLDGTPPSPPPITSRIRSRSGRAPGPDPGPPRDRGVRPPTPGPGARPARPRTSPGQRLGAWRSQQPPVLGTASLTSDHPFSGP